MSQQVITSDSVARSENSDSKGSNTPPETRAKLLSIPPEFDKLREISDRLLAQIFHFIGNTGKTQKLMFISAILALLGCATSITVVSYAAPDPTTKCASSSNPNELVNCPESQACLFRSEGKPYKIEFDYDNWTQQYNMVCENAGKRQFAKSLFIFMITVVSMVSLFLTDIFGRKLGFLVIFVASSAGVVISTFVPNYTFKLIGFGIANASFNSFSSLFTIAFSELLPKESPLRSYVVAGMFAANPIGSICFAGVTIFTKDPTVLAWITLVTTVITSLLPVLAVPESPMYLLEKNKIPEFCSVLRSVRESNKLPEDEHMLAKIRDTASEWVVQNDIDTVAAGGSQSQTSSTGLEPIKALVSNSKDLLYTLGLSLIAGVTFILFFNITLNLTALGSGDASLNGMILNILVIGINFAIMPISSTMPRKKWMLIFQSMYVIGGVLLVVFGRMGLLEGQNTGQKLLNLFITVGIIGVPSFAIYTPLFYYIAETFPVKIKGTAYSIVQFLANLAGMGTPYICEWSQQLGLHFLTLSAFLGMLSLAVTVRMREIIPQEDGEVETHQQNMFAK